MSNVELSGVSIVGAGAFNPAIIHPQWLAAKDLIPENIAAYAMEAASQDATGDASLIVSSQLAAFTADWLTVQVATRLLDGRGGKEPDLRDLAMAIFDLLPETPVDAIGINVGWHVRANSEADWHAFGDRFLPKDFWHNIFEVSQWRERDDGETVGLRTMTVEASRAEDSRRAGVVRVEVAPSVRVLPGIYAAVNSHFQLTLPEKSRGSGYEAARTLEDEWEESRAMQQSMLTRLFESR